MLNQSTQNQFYPTPDNIARKIRQTVTKPITRKTRILDCSAGDGALLEPFLRTVNCEFSHEERKYAAKNLFAIEIDQDLRYVLSGKGFSVIGTDFLLFEEPQKFDVIVMNPPFNDGCSHVLHAWDFLADGGELVALLNQETIDNPFSKERQLLASIIETYGSTTNLGPAFSEAKRKTNVDVAMIKLSKPKGDPSRFIGFDATRFNQDNISDEDFAANPLAKTDYIKNLCDRYKAAEQALVARHEAQKTLNFYLQDLGSEVSRCISRDENDILDSLRCNPTLEEQLSAVKLRFWDELFSKSKLTSKATSDFKAKFMAFAESQQRMSFTYENCLEVLLSVLGNSENIFKDAIDSLFQVGCSFDKENTVHWEGWAANDSWKWNKKLIIPYAFSWSNRMGFTESYGEFGNRAKRFLDDLDKVLSNISGEAEYISSGSAYNAHIRGLSSFNSRYDVEFSSWIITTFIRFRIYKKGTIHIEFLDKTLLDEFNRRAAEGKPWMPKKSSYKQPKYRQKQLAAA
jgi:16S rRNA G966 N2-methylase RsmD